MPRLRKLHYDKDLMKAVKIDTQLRCESCCHPHDPTAGYTLTVHHLDLNWENNKLWNLAALCQRCHLQLQPFNAFNNLLSGQWGYYLSHCALWFKPHLAFFLETDGKEVWHGRAN